MSSDRLYGRPEVSVREISGIVYGSGSEDPPEYPAGSALRSPDGPLGAVVHPEITNNIPKAKKEQAAIRIRAAPAGPRHRPLASGIVRCGSRPD